MVDGTVNYIGAISTNNGIRQTINPPFVWKGNCITVNYNGSVGHAYYQPTVFYASDDVNILYSKGFTLDENIALYLCTAIFKASAKYSYSTKWTKERMENSSIILPLYSQNIDFKFMRRYIATLKAERVATLKAYLQAAGLSDTILSESELAALDALRQNRVEWREKPICGKYGAFSVVNTHSILKSQVVPDSGNIPYVGAGESNNSIQSYISFDSNFIEKGNSIMIGGKTLVITYQEQDYISNDSHNLALYYHDIEIPNRNLQLFLVSALYRSLKPKYHWGDSISKSKIKNDVLMLPINNKGDIDYAFIDNLISAQAKLCIREILANNDLEISATEKVISDSSYFNNDESDTIVEPSQAAEPFEVYKWHEIEQTEKNGTSKQETILIGCYRDRKHLEWILDNHIYNIRLGRRKGSMDNHEYIEKANKLYLYDVNNTSKVYVFRISGNKEMTGAELRSLNYPRKSPGKCYMTFKIDEIDCTKDDNIPLFNLKAVLDKLPNHVNGAPVFIEPIN